MKTVVVFIVLMFNILCGLPHCWIHSYETGRVRTESNQSVLWFCCQSRRYDKECYSRCGSQRFARQSESGQWRKLWANFFSLSRASWIKSLITAYYGQSWLTSEFENAIEAIQGGNNEVHFGEEKSLAAAHFDSEQFQSGQERLIVLRQNVVSSILARNFDVARTDTGSILHALQDFYSHSNWVENGNTSPNHALGKPNERLDNVAGRTRQTCVNCKEKGFWFTKYYECQDNIESSLQRDGVLTSGYYGGLKVAISDLVIFTSLLRTKVSYY